MRKLEQQERVLQTREAKLEGGKLGTRRTEREEAAFRQQGHVRADQMTPEEKTKLEQELDQMWSSVPEHMREKARRMQGH